MKLAPHSETYKRAERNADVARGAFLHSLHEIRNRLAPRQLKREAIQKLDERLYATAQKARNHPFIIGAVLSGTVGLLLRKPILIWSRSAAAFLRRRWNDIRSEEHTSELQSLMRISYAVFCLKKK